MKTFKFLLGILLSIAITACGGGGGTSVVQSKSNLKAVFQYSFSSPSASGVINEQAKTIDVTVPFGTNVTMLVASFATTGQNVTVNNTAQASGVTANNFTNPVTYTVAAEDGTTATYTVTVVVAPSSAKAITAFSFSSLATTGVINESGKSITITVPSGTNVTAIVATFITNGASVKVGATVQASGATANNFTNSVLYRVTAADASFVDYTITVVVAPSTAKALTYFAFTSLPATGVIDEAAKTISVTVPFATNITGLAATFSSTGVSVTVGGVAQVNGSTLNNFSLGALSYVVTAADGSTATYAVTVTVAPNSAKAITAFSFNTPVASGVIDEANKLIAITVPSGTNRQTLVATFSHNGQNITVGGVAQTSGVTVNNFMSPVTYVVTAADSSTATYVVTVTVAASTTKAITAFSFATNPVANGVIDEVAKTIAVKVPSNYNIAALAATFTTTGTSVKVGGTSQTSGSTTNSFTTPVTYTVTAADGSAVNYTVTVTVPPPGVLWATQTSGTSVGLYGVTWSGTQFVAVGLSGTILTSPDGVTWIARTSGTPTVNLFGVTWSGTQFVVVGSVGTILTSPDGVTWTARTSGTTNNLAAVTWSGTQFVAVSATGLWGGTATPAVILTSPDGVTWSAPASGSYATNYTDVAWSGTQFVAVGDTGASKYSPDGINWTGNWVSQASLACYGITWSGTQFVEVGAGGDINTSPDGVTWTRQWSGGSLFISVPGALYDVTWSGAQFVVVGNSGTSGTILTSPDGVTWTGRTSGTANGLRGIAWSGTKFVSVGLNGVILTSQ